MAGNGQQGNIDAGALDSTFFAPFALALQGTASLYIGDNGNQTIRKFDLSSKQVTTVAGSGSAGFADAIGRSASFSLIRGIAVDSAGNLYVADAGANDIIRKVNMSSPSNPVVTTFAGVQGVAGANNGNGATSTFDNPWGLVIKGSMLYVADAGNHVIRQIDLNSQTVSTIAGSGVNGSGDGPGSVAQFSSPAALAIDKSGNLIVTDTGNHLIRSVSLSDGSFTVKTIAGAGVSGSTDGNGQGAAFNSPDGAAVGTDGYLYVSDRNNHAIRRVNLADSSYPVTTYAGGTQAGYQDAQGTNAQFSSPAGLVMINNALYVADPGNLRVRLVQ